MRRLLGLLAGLAILALFPLAATVSARVSDEGAGKVVRTAGNTSGSSSTSSDPNELSGTLSVSGSTATVTAEDGSTLSCTIPAGMDLTAWNGQQVEMECDGGVVTEVKNLATGEEIEADDDDCTATTSTSSSDDEGDEADDDDECDSASSDDDDGADDDEADDGDDDD